jgi:hypothetical protein
MVRAIVLAGVVSCSSNQTPGSGESMQPARGDAASADGDPTDGGAPLDDSDASTSDDGAPTDDDALSPPDAGCTAAAPLSCPTPIPSYAQDVARVLNAKCNGCHTGAPGAPWALVDWADVNAWALSIAHDVSTCSMPPADAGAPALSQAETDAILGWIVCGAPDN